MVALGYTVIAADVTRVTTRNVWLTPHSGPREGESICLPKSVFEEPEFVELGDDEVVLADWMAAKENLA